MASSGPRDDEDAPDPAEELDATSPDEEAFDGYALDGDDEDLSLDDRDFTGDDEGEEAFDDDTAAVQEPGTADEADGPEELQPLLADDEELAEVVAAVDQDEDGDEEDVLREGEFICRSCFMAKRDSALADEDAMLCRDCV